MTLIAPNLRYRQVTLVSGYPVLQLSNDHNMDAYYQVKPRLQAPTLVRKFNISHWLPCGAGVRSRNYQNFWDG